jgi:SNF2 family DNA or RNA helicase
MDTDIIPGALIQHDAFIEYGVIVRVVDGVASVLFDDNVMREIVDLSTLSRVQLPRRLKRISTGQQCFLVDNKSVSPPTWTVFVSFDQPEIEVSEADLRPDLSIDPYAQAIDGRPAGALDETLVATAAHFLRNEHRNNDLVSLDGARVDVKPHQVSVVHRVVSNMPHRYLLCDEVGLGKTIEAAMVIKELRARGEALRVLVIVPASLTRQWQFELKSKFNEVFSILNSETIRAIAGERPEENPFTRYESVIVSKDWISNKDRAKLAAEAAWDLIIVDEAHHARKHQDGTETQLYKAVYGLTDIAKFPDRAVLFLTATPMQLAAQELYSLIEMVDPTLFPSVEAFNGHRQALPQLNELASMIEAASDLSSLPEKATNLLSDWLQITIEHARELLASGDKADILDSLGKKHLITEVLIRNRKVNVLKFSERRAHRWNVELTEEEKNVIDAIEDYVELGYRNAASAKLNSIGFLMTTYQKMMASSLRTIGDSLKRRLVKLEGLSTNQELSEEEIQPLLEDLNLDSEDKSIAQAVGNPLITDTEVDQLRGLVRMLDEIKIDSKARALVNNMEELANSDVPKVLIFTEYRGTQNYLADVLREAGWTVNLFHGSQTAQKKDDSVEAFRSGEGRQVLIATEAGAEGRNFQFCHMLINYDLPWNPMTVEQRIGRVDRMGQQNTVLVFNFCVLGSIEERVLDVLEKRINLFEITVGGLDPILGEVAGDLRTIMQKARLDRPSAIDALGKRLEGDVMAARQAGERLQDLFMDTKSYSVEIAERIIGQRSEVDAATQELFMKRLLKTHNTYMSRDDDLKEYKVVFHAPFIGKHPDLFRHPQDKTRRVVFRNDERPDSDYVQYLAFGHPVIEAAVGDVVVPYWPGAMGSRKITGGPDMPSTSGWLMLYEIEVADIKSQSILVPAFVDDSGLLNVEMGKKFVLRALSDEIESQGTIDSNARTILRTSKACADDYIETLMKETLEQLSKTSLEKCELASDRLRAYCETRINNCEIKIAATKEHIDRVNESDDESQKRIIPVWQKRLADAEARIVSLQDELANGLRRLNVLQNASCTPRLLQVVRIEVVNAE